MEFKYSPFSKKQMQLLTWWTDESPYKDCRGIIAEGAIRAGKTILEGLSFTFWSTLNFNRSNFAICGKTVSSAKRNIVEPLIGLLKMRGYKVVFKEAQGKLIVAGNDHINTYYIFGGKDESSAQLIQGITLAGVLFDEVALMPQSFVNQAIARCSVKGAKYWFNCNPEGPRHWFKLEHVDKWKEKKYLRLHFRLEDNPSLDQETIEKYYSMFQGIFYRRFILGEWAFADGVVYSDIPESTWYNAETRDKVLPVKCREHDVHPYYACDYGTANPHVYLEIYKYKRPGESIPYFYVDNEYYWNSKIAMKQKTNEEYVADFQSFISDPMYKYLIVDPSATSFIETARRQGIRVMKANNDVREGITMLASLFAMGHVFINEDRCKNLKAELGLYIWDQKKAERGIEDVVKANDHACDAFRYGVKTVTPQWELYSSLKG